MNEPGPLSQIIKLISFKVKFVCLNAFSIIGIKFSECVLPVSESKVQSGFVSSKIETPHILLAVSILKIFIINFIPF